MHGISFVSLGYLKKVKLHVEKEKCLHLVSETSESILH